LHKWRNFYAGVRFEPRRHRVTEFLFDFLRVFVPQWLGVGLLQEAY
jgi:hypothetical protein